MNLFSRKKQGKKTDPQPESNEGSTGWEYEFREMFAQDVREVLNLVALFDEDDAEEMDEHFKGEGLTGFYIAMIDGRIAGVIGASVANGAPTTAWLDWFYVHPDILRKGVGTYLYEGLIQSMQGSPLIRIFVPISDYREDGKDVYAPARAMAKKLNATEELYLADYYDDGEGRHIYRLNMQAEPDTTGQVLTKSAYFEDIEEIEDSDGAYALTWRDTDPSKRLNTEKTSELLAQARDEGGHVAFVAFPSSISDTIAADLREAGFKEEGRLKDYFESGVNATYWSQKL